MRSSLEKRLLLLCKHFFSFLQICIDAGHKDKMYRLRHGHKVQSGCMKERRPIQFLKCSIVLFKNAQISMHRWPYSVMPIYQHNTYSVWRFSWLRTIASCSCFVTEFESSNKLHGNQQIMYPSLFIRVHVKPSRDVRNRIQADRL